MKKDSLSRASVVAIVGYIIIVIIMLGGLFAIYTTLVDFTDKKINRDEISELLLVGNTLSLMYDVESEQNLLTPEGARRYFEKFDSIYPLIADNIDDLKIRAKDSIRINDLDSILHLVALKKDNLLQVADLLDSLNRAPDIVKSVEESKESRGLKKDISDLIANNEMETEREKVVSDTNIVVNKKKRFFDRVRDVFTGKNDTTIVIENRTYENNDVQLMIDTIVYKVKESERLDFSRQKKIYSELITRQEEMRNTNSMLTLKIDNLLKEIEQEEFMRTLNLINERQATIDKSNRTLSMTTTLGVLSAIIFATMVLLLFNRSQKYKQQLEESNKRITDLLDSRQKLMLTISHDIKAPIGSIIGFIDLLDDDISKKDKYLSSMKASANHVLHLVSTLLNFQKLNAGVWQFNNSNFNVYRVVSDTTCSFEALAANKGLTYNVENSISKDVCCYGDQYVLRQILGNLISNAIKYTVVGEVGVTARMDRVGAHNRLVFSIKDTGVGISPLEQEEIFKEFKQLRKENEELHVDGIGLGLSITKRFIDQLGGSIMLISEKGVGSEFIIEIPYDDAIKVVEQESEKEEGDAPLSDMRILVIDDDPSQLMMVSEMIKKLGLECVAENIPEEVVRRMRSEKFDLLLVDLDLGDTTGYELVDEIKRLEDNNNKDVPIIALSARDDMTDMKMHSAGFAGFMNKPFTIGELRNMIGKYVLNNKDEVITNVETEELVAEGIGKLVEFVKDDKEAAKDIIASFIKETKAYSEDLKKAFGENNVDNASSIAHKLLPLFKIIDDKAVVDLLLRVEKKEILSEKEQTSLTDYLGNHVADAERFHSQLEDAGGE
ncbi:MAG: hybrid sensor histidine kinase/response regulator [Fermentimonas sp.]|jgi:two-component system sensor histidine kinase EvgS